MNAETSERNLSTADLVAATEEPAARRSAAPEPRTQEQQRQQRQEQRQGQRPDSAPKNEDEQLAPLFLPESAQAFRAQWDAVQIGFVDDPKQAVQQADELVAQVMKSLAETFANERAQLEGQVQQADQVSTENLRVALRHYRSFFQRLLSL
jgi:hypothetical protein